MFGSGSKDEDNRADEDPKTLIHFTELRAANVARQAEWDKDSQAQTLEWRANELFGEAGEAANILKKLHRERVGVPGSRAKKIDLAEELADVLICLDLFAMTADIAMADRYYEDTKIDATMPLLRYGTLMGAHVGAICEYALLAGPLGKERLLVAIEHLRETAIMCGRSEGINMQQAVSDKFNATSRKMGLTARLADGLA